jgi:hypothetical protein
MIQKPEVVTKGWNYKPIMRETTSQFSTQNPSTKRPVRSNQSPCIIGNIGHYEAEFALLVPIVTLLKVALKT